MFHSGLVEKKLIDKRSVFDMQREQIKSPFAPQRLVKCRQTIAEFALDRVTEQISTQQKRQRCARRRCKADQHQRPPKLKEPRQHQRHRQVDVGRPGDRRRDRRVSRRLHTVRRRVPAGREEKECAHGLPALGQERAFGLSQPRGAQVRRDADSARAGDGPDQ